MLHTSGRALLLSKIVVSSQVLALSTPSVHPVHPVQAMLKDYALGAGVDDGSQWPNKALFDRFDMDGNGRIERGEFMLAVRAAHTLI